MRMLILGGTVFLSKAVAAEAVEAGHEVVCAARGRSGEVPAGARLVRVDRDDPGGLAALAGEKFDAVVDVATISYPWVAEALRALAPRAAHWTFVSSVSVYSDMSTLGQRPGAPVIAPRQRAGTAALDVDPELYGAVKVASEDAVRQAMGERALVLRPGTIVGPGDVTDRFGYWPGRMSRGGEIAVPDVPAQRTQYVDVRDLAAFIVLASERRLNGSYDVIGPPTPLTELLANIAAGFDVELVPVATKLLTEAGIAPWGGQRSLPLWLPETHLGMCAHDAEPVLAAGLRVRPLAETVSAALRHEQKLGLHRDRKAGLTPTEEADLLARIG